MGGPSLRAWGTIKRNASAFLQRKMLPGDFPRRLSRVLNEPSGVQGHFSLEEAQRPGGAIRSKDLLYLKKSLGLDADVILPSKAKIPDILEDKRCGGNPKCEIRLRLDPGEDIVDIQDKLIAFIVRSDCLNDDVVPAHLLEVAIGPYPLSQLIEFAARYHADSRFQPRSRRAAFVCDHSIDDAVDGKRNPFRLFCGKRPAFESSSTYCRTKRIVGNSPVVPINAGPTRCPFFLRENAGNKDIFSGTDQRWWKNLPVLGAITLWTFFPKKTQPNVIKYVVC